MKMCLYKINSVANKHFILSAVILDVIMLSVVAPINDDTGIFLNI